MPRRTTSRAARAARALARAGAREHRPSPRELGHSLSCDEVAALCRGERGRPVAVAPYSRVFGGSDLELPAVFLWRETPDYGHWCAAWERKPGVLAVFDSYGVAPPDAWRRGADASALEELGQERARILDHALSRRFSRVEWNDHPLQASTPEVTTCGRWCALRLAFRELDPEEFAYACQTAANALGVELDDLVVRLTRA